MASGLKWQKKILYDALISKIPELGEITPLTGDGIYLKNRDATTSVTILPYINNEALRALSFSDFLTCLPEEVREDFSKQMILLLKLVDSTGRMIYKISGELRLQEGDVKIRIVHNEETYEIIINNITRLAKPMAKGKNEQLDRQFQDIIKFINTRLEFTPARSI